MIKNKIIKKKSHNLCNKIIANNWFKIAESKEKIIIIIQLKYKKQKQHMIQTKFTITLFRNLLLNKNRIWIK